MTTEVFVGGLASLLLAAVVIGVLTATGQGSREKSANADSSDKKR